MDTALRTYVAQVGAAVGVAVGEGVGVTVGAELSETVWVLGSATPTMDTLSVQDVETVCMKSDVEAVARFGPRADENF